MRPHTEVADRVVVALGVSGDKRLVAYVVASGGAAPSPDLVCVQLVTSLPDYMIPADSVAVDRLPLSPSGKIDTRTSSTSEAPPSSPFSC
ncbi:AMP-binding enzyme [Streptomyces huasconensis]|uniref:AMP-binding enzyme n=1 Tax=Streptomyces huasconensis TaxID=1854574 RepID=UPI0033FACFDF